MDAAPGNAVHHLGYFTDNLDETADALQAQRLHASRCATAVDGETPSMFAYYVARGCPHRDRRPRRLPRLGRLPESGTSDDDVRSCGSTSPAPHGDPRTQRPDRRSPGTGAVGGVARCHRRQRRRAPRDRARVELQSDHGRGDLPGADRTRRSRASTARSARCGIRCDSPRTSHSSTP